VTRKELFTHAAVLAYPVTGLIVGMVITFTQHHALALGVWGYLVISAASVVSGLVTATGRHVLTLGAQVIVVAGTVILLTVGWQPSVPLVIALVATISLLQWMRGPAITNLRGTLIYLALPVAVGIAASAEIAIVGVIGAWAIIMGVFTTLAHIDSVRTAAKERQHG
jgi:hypothetical protein